MDLAWHNNLYRAYNLPATVAALEVPFGLSLTIPNFTRLASRRNVKLYHTSRIRRSEAATRSLIWRKVFQKLERLIGYGKEQRRRKWDGICGCKFNIQCKRSLIDIMYYVLIWHGFNACRISSTVARYVPQSSESQRCISRLTRRSAITYPILKIHSALVKISIEKCRDLLISSWRIVEHG